MLNYVEPTLLKSTFNIAAFIKLSADTHGLDLNRVKLVSEVIFGFLVATIAAVFSLSTKSAPYLFQFFLPVVENYYTQYIV
jgi:hypothetical protein